MGLGCHHSYSGETQVWISWPRCQKNWAIVNFTTYYFTWCLAIALLKVSELVFGSREGEVGRDMFGDVDDEKGAGVVSLPEDDEDDTDVLDGAGVVSLPEDLVGAGVRRRELTLSTAATSCTDMMDLSQSFTTFVYPEHFSCKIEIG